MESLKQKIIDTVLGALMSVALLSLFFLIFISLYIMVEMIIAW